MSISWLYALNGETVRCLVKMKNIGVYPTYKYDNAYRSEQKTSTNQVPGSAMWFVKNCLSKEIATKAALKVRDTF